MSDHSQLKIFSPLTTKKSEYFKKIKLSKIKGAAPYLLDWTFIFEYIDKYKHENKKKQCVILDVGCGNSMFHTFLENYYGQGIIGIDRTDSTMQKDELERLGHTVTNATDLCINFITEGRNYFNNNVDIIYWNSSIEHNSLDQMREAIKISMESLRVGGLFLATWALGEKTHWNEPALATVLSPDEASSIFQEDWKIQPEFDQIVDEWKSNELGLDSWHKNRFGHNNYEYVHAGSLKIK